ncbi:MAG TPA: sigma factor [Actinomycetota bacterium]
MEESAQSSHGSLADLYIRYLPVAVRLGYLLTGNREQGEDLAQEAFVRLTGTFGHVRARELFEAYLRRTVVNLFISQTRRRKLERRHLEAESQDLRRSLAMSGESVDVASKETL